MEHKSRCSSRLAYYLQLVVLPRSDKRGGIQKDKYSGKICDAPIPVLTPKPYGGYSSCGWQQGPLQDSQSRRSNPWIKHLPSPKRIAAAAMNPHGCRVLKLAEDILQRETQVDKSHITLSDTVHGLNKDL